MNELSNALNEWTQTEMKKGVESHTHTHTHTSSPRMKTHRPHGARLSVHVLQDSAGGETAKMSIEPRLWVRACE